MRPVGKYHKATKCTQGSVHSQNGAPTPVCKCTPMPMVSLYPFSVPWQQAMASATSIWACSGSILPLFSSHLMALKGLQAREPWLLEEPNLPLAQPPLPSKMQNIVWLGSPVAKSPLLCRTVSWKSRSSELKQEIDPFLLAGSVEGRMAWGRHGDAVLGRIRTSSFPFLASISYLRRGLEARDHRWGGRTEGIWLCFSNSIFGLTEALECPFPFDLKLNQSTPTIGPSLLKTSDMEFNVF